MYGWLAIILYELLAILWERLHRRRPHLPPPPHLMSTACRSRWRNRPLARALLAACWVLTGIHLFTEKPLANRPPA